MDSSEKPKKENPRQFAHILSQLTFGWSIPLLYRGSRQGLTADDLTKCLPEDLSQDLGDKLERNWFKEIEVSRYNNREPHLRNAILRTFYRSAIVDGIICLVYIVLKSVIPAVLAQLLLQFERPSAISNNSLLSNTTHHRHIRSIVSTRGNNEDNVISLNKNEATAQKLPSTNSNSTQIEEENWEFVENFNEILHFIWNDVHWLGAILVCSTLLGCFLIHHVDLRQRLLGARMRIACCSLIYRKTIAMSMRSAGQTPAGYLINLLSNDVNRLDYGFIFVHWIWIMPIQAVLICYLISTRIGLAAVVGVVGLLLKTIPVQTGLSKLASKLRMKIAERTDARVGIMNELVQGIQVIKMYAWEKPFQTVVKEARRREIKQIRYASYLRGFYLSTMVFTERSTLYITIAAAVFMGNTISADIVFAMAGYYNILQLVAAIWYPLAVSFGAEALVSLTRIQAFLQQDDCENRTRGITYKMDRMSSSGNVKAVVIQEATAKWDPSKVKLTLDKIELSIPKGKLCAIVGPVGAGKSSIMQLILGELPLTDGGVVINGTISYAAQEPWLFSGTVRNNILFGEEYTKARYREITKCCALSADFEQLPYGDKTIVGERGASLSGGQRARISLARAIYKPASIYLLDDPLSAVDAHVGRHLFEEVIGPRSCLAQQNVTRILITHQVHFLNEADWIVIIENGRISRQGTYKELIISELDFAKLLERPQRENSKSESTTSNSEEYSNKEEEDIPYIDGVRENGYQPLRRASSNEGSQSRNSENADAELTDKIAAEEQAGGGVSLRVWNAYFRAGSTLVGLSFMVFVMLLSQIVCSGSDYFVNIWTQQEYLRSINETTILTTYECLYIYGALIVGVVIMTIFRGFLFFKVCMHASKILHDRMFYSILHAVMKFFDSNPSGRILNRFSKDMGAIDEFLPKAMMDFIQIALVMIGILIVICVVNPILMAAIAIVTVLDILILRLYLRPSQDLKRLEGICRSPVFSHLSSSLSGLATIRSRNLHKIVIREFDDLQNVHSAVWQLTMAANTALGLWLDCVSCCFLTSVTFSFIVLSQQTYSGNVGLAISQAMILTGMVQYGVRQVAESLQQMTSVERVLQYTDIEQESDSNKPPPNVWPSHGLIEFRNVYCRYDPNKSPILRDLNIIIEPGWKVGIVGRTGAGKSSFIGALFRLTYIEGSILIDGIDTNSISLETLRSKISIIPQDPVLFSATIRYNLDPFEKYSDSELWRALEDVELKGAIPGLDFIVTERGSNFSVGQRQLLCLARAILRNNRILVLDEATANVDPQTDALIQRTIRLKFKHCTVLTVAHRLQTVMDSDRILVMDAGLVREFDKPYILMKNSHGTLRQMVEATGSEAEMLKYMASQAYRKHKI
ncbi:multidrug resistance-associated protein 4 [Glossina fuscipes]|uniref:Multidrug resistance-associated protein 4 n=1 Tax=Glossina fuscipes TaxID=7396 RepID=A0A9C5ZAX5_9MUSC|nr:multidrug resistance-associated protein 4 [Glossina fuscipes]XP_037896203.1 multidrug resistance-associated protein 4 [Glossina fuscipes]